MDRRKYVSETSGKVRGGTDMGHLSQGVGLLTGIAQAALRRLVEGECAWWGKLGS